MVVQNKRWKRRGRLASEDTVAVHLAKAKSQQLTLNNNAGRVFGRHVGTSRSQDGAARWQDNALALLKGWVHVGRVAGQERGTYRGPPPTAAAARGGSSLNWALFLGRWKLSRQWALQWAQTAFDAAGRREQVGD